MELQLNIERVKEIPLDQYDKNFTFVVNNEQYHTCRIIADILSPTIDEFHIKTSHTGNFEHILNLINYNSFSL